MTAATLNGQSVLGLPGGSELVAQTDDGMSYATFARLREGEEIWSTAPVPIGPEPTRRCSTSSSADYIAVAWPQASAIAVLGDSMAVVLSLVSGEILGSYSLEFTTKESLEQAGLEVDSGRGVLLIISTRRLWVIGPSLEPVLRYDPRFMLAGRPAIRGSQLHIPEFDFDNDREVVEQVLEL